MKKKIIFLPLLVCALILLTGCDLNKKEVTEAKSTKVSISGEELKELEKLSDVVFEVEKTSLKKENITEERKAEIARKLQNDYLNVTGSKMIVDFQKNFGEDQTITFENIPCPMEHEKEEEDILYIFDKDQDKYVYNEKHPGHGGGASGIIGYEMSLENVSIKGEEYRYDVKVLFYGKFGFSDIGPAHYGKAYKSYEDAKNKTNPLVDIDNNSDYVTQYDPSEPPETHIDKVMEDMKDHLDTYEFVFKMVNGNLVFQSYSKK